MITSSSSKLFADDSMLFRMVQNDNDRASLQKDLSALEEWESQWQMSFNAAKCSVIRIVPRGRATINTHYVLHGHTLEVVDASKYLGVTLTDNLSWDCHISNITSKAHRTLGFLRRNIKECTPPVREASYKAMVRPIIENAATVWDPTQASHIKKLEQVQRRAARFVYNDYSTTTPGCVSNMLKDLNWESLESRRRQSRLCMMYKIQNRLFQVFDIAADTY